MSTLPRRATGVLTAAALGCATLSTILLTPATSAAVEQHREGPAPVLGQERAGAIRGRYIVVLEDQAAASARSETRRQAIGHGGRVSHEYTAALRGFAATLPDRAVEALRRNPAVAYLEADRRVGLEATQSPATWGLDRVDQRSLPLSSSYTYDQTGSGVTAYVIDTGILATHSEFTGRTAAGFTAVTDGRGTTDCNGHGTHVAGTLGGTRYGVAKRVTLRPVRVLGCTGNGSTSGVIAGVDWVTSHHAAGAPAVANMSLGGAASPALDTAVANSISDGVTYAVAAGNDSAANACGYSPARVGAALTVGSTTNSDARSSFSNIGSCLDLFAPGSGITSAWHTSTTATTTISGTSMATPHVAGAAALHLEANPGASPSTVAAAVVHNATTGVVTNAGTGSPNRLLHARSGSTPTPPPPSSGNLLGNPGFESGATAWSATAGVITSSLMRPARTGTWKAWLNGYGGSHTDTLSQTVALPSGSRATLGFWIRIDTSEITTSTVYDRLRVQATSGGTTHTLATYSNLNASATYLQKSLDLSAYAGRTVTVRFVGTENSTRQTSFVIDDTSLTAG